jgi:predicted nucleotidyltransferase
MNEILFKTNVGSHMWKMNNENSDTDLFECYIMPTTEVLKGKISRAHFIQDKENRIDIQSHEISKVTSEIIKSNINYIGYVFSPIVLEGQKFLERYRQLAVKVISKRVYDSIHGLAIHNYKKYQTDFSVTRWNKIIRVMRFGINLMDLQKIEFEPFENGSADVYKISMELLDYYKKNGNLQEEPLEEDVENLWDFVVNERIKRLKINGSEIR